MSPGRDSFADAIAEKLRGPLDPRVFEACACDLLRDAYPSLAPIPGGSDAGRDGAIAAAGGPSIPLVVTTGESVIANLTRSLDSYLAASGLSCQVVVATSQSLTARQVRNLEKRASEKGFTLLPVYQHQAWVDRLYHSPRWCGELLGLASEPAALAPIPSGRRPLMDGSLVGQEEALEWLRTTSGDRILAGPPGAGKTYLLFHLAREGFGLFLESDDSARILEDLRRRQPSVVIVDDAHIRLSRLALLRDLRRQHAALTFDIVATTWEEQDQEAVARELATSAVHRLRALPRDQIVEILRQVGIINPPHLVRELVDQARGRPGLAVTLAHFCLQGGWREVVYGHALSRDLLGQLKERLGHRAADVLATLALGGKRGMPVEAAATYLELSPGEVQNVLAFLSPAGVITPAEQVVVVRPRALRYALVRDYFLDERPGSFEIDKVLPLVPFPEDAAETMLGAAHRGATLPTDIIEPLLVAHPTERAWDAYAALGQVQTRWALSNWRGSVADIARGCLAGDPADTVVALLHQADGDDRREHSTAGKPLRILTDWVEDLQVAEANPAASMRRREIILDGVITFLAQGGDEAVAVRGLVLALDPKVEGSTSDPGKGLTVSFRQGVVSSSMIEKMEALWPRVLTVLSSATSVPWEPIQHLLRQWTSPSLLAPGVDLGEAFIDRMRSFAAHVVQDLATILGKDPGVARRLKDYAEQLGVKADFTTDPLLDLLTPQDSRWGENWQERQEEHGKKLETAADQWAVIEPGLLVQALAQTHANAQRGKIHLDRWLWSFCRRVVAQSPHALPDYLFACLTADPPVPGLVSALLDRLVDSRHPDVLDLASRCLASDSYQHLGVEAVLKHESPPAALLTQALATVAQFPQLVEIITLRKQVPIPNLLALLQHPDPKVALYAAEGEWHGGDKGTIREPLQTAWREAVLRAPLSDDDGERLDNGQRWFLGQALAADPELAFDWLANQMATSKAWWHSFVHDQDTAAMAVTGLTTEQRIALLDKVPLKWDWGDLVACLVGDDLEVYRALLATPKLARFHGAPLRRGPDPSWPEKAAIALAAGVSPADIAQETLMGSGFTIAGSRADHWRGKIAELEKIAAGRPELMVVVEAARHLVAPDIARAEAEDRHVELYGLDDDP